MQRQVHACGQADRSGAVVQTRRQQVERRQVGHRPCGADPAVPDHVGQDDVSRAGLDQLEMSVGDPQRLTRRDRRDAGRPHLGERGRVLVPDRVLDPDRFELGYRTHHPLGGGHVPAAPALDRDLHGVPHRAADLSEYAKASFQVLEPEDVAVAVGQPGVERKDLHGPDPGIEQVTGEVAGRLERRPHVLVPASWFGRREQVVADRQRRPHVPGADARVVHGHPIPAGAAQHPMDRQSPDLPDEVPQRHLHSGRRSGLGTDALARPQHHEFLLVSTDQPGISTEQVGRGEVVNVRLGGPDPEPRLAESDLPRRAGQPDPQHVRLPLAPDGGDSGDFKVGLCRRHSPSPVQTPLPSN